MIAIKPRLGRTVLAFLVSAVAAYLGSGTALATCTPTLPTAGSSTPVSVPCYIKVQPIDVGTTVNGSIVYAPFNTTSQTGNPSNAGMPFSTNPITATLLPNNPTSTASWSIRPRDCFPVNRATHWERESTSPGRC